MIPPYELKEKTFQTAFKGYAKAEVDEYLAFVIEKYTELYRTQDTLTRRLAEVEAELSELKKKEDAIRQVLVNSETAARRLTDEAEKRAELILSSTTENCERILSEFRVQIKTEIDTLKALRAQVLDFKSKMFAQYQKHIELIKNITPGSISEGDFALSPNEYAAKVLSQARIDTRVGVTRREREEEKALRAAIKQTVEQILSPDGDKKTE